jgi:hypothetical protein
LAHWRVEHSAEEQGRVMAAGAPFRGAYADNVLHVFDAFAIPLIIERGEAMSGTAPLVVDVGMAALARLRLHEEFCRDRAPMRRLSRTGKELAIHSIAFVCLSLGRHRRILNAMRIAPAHFAHGPRRSTQDCDGQQKTGKRSDRTPHSSCKKKDNAERRNADMAIKQRRKWTRSPCECQNDSDQGARGRNDPTCGS